MEMDSPKLLWQSMEPVLAKLGGRVRFSCLDVSSALIVFGANTGTLYFYEREQLRLVTLISSKEIREPISSVRLSPGGNLLALSTSKGFLFVLELNLNSRKEKEKIVAKVCHKESLACLCWSEDGGSLFFSDESGGTFLVSLSKARAAFFSDFVPECVHRDGSSIVQLCYREGELLVSSLTRCFVVNLAKQSCAQVGSQARDGRFGGTFHPDRSIGDFLLAARPGKRIWLAECSSGTVHKTLNFKDTAGSAPTPLLPAPDPAQQPVDVQSANFSKVLGLTDSLVLAWDTNAIFLIDVTTIRVVQWHADICNIQDLALHQNEIYVLHGASKTQVSKLSLWPFSQARAAERPAPQQAERQPEDQRQQPEEPQQQQEERPAELASPTTQPLLGGQNLFDNTNEEFPVPEARPAPVKLKLKPKKKGRRKGTNIVEILSPGSLPMPRSTSSTDILSQGTAPSPVLPSHRRSNSEAAEAREPKRAPESSPPAPQPDPAGPEADQGAELAKRRSESSLESLADTLKKRTEALEPASIVESWRKKKESLESFKVPREGLSQSLDGLKTGLSKIASNIKQTNNLERQLTSLIQKIPEKVIKPDPARSAPARAAAEEQFRPTPFYTLTKSMFDTLSQQTFEKRSEVLAVSIDEWLESFGAEECAQVPAEWTREILTTYLELKLRRGAWPEAEGFVAQHFQWIVLPRAYAALNRSQQEEAIQQLHQLEQQRSEESHQALAALLEQYLSEGDGGSALGLLKKRGSLGLTLQHLGRVLALNPRGTLDYCVSEYPSIQPWNVEPIRMTQPAMHLYYLTQLMRSQPETRSNAHLVELWFESNLMDGAPPLDSLYTEENLPRRDAYLHPWPHAAVLDEIIQNPRTYSYTPAHLRLMSLKYGYFRGLVEMYVQARDIQKALDVVIETDDLPSFLKMVGAASLEPDHWKYAFAQIHKLRGRPRAEVEGRLVTKDSVATQMIIRVGVSECLEILGEIPAFTEGISHSVFGHFIQKGNVEKEQSLVVHEMLESIDSYLWSSRPTAIAPQIRNLLDSEVAASLAQLPFVRPGEDPELRFDQNVPLPRFYEEAAGHWGALLALSGSACPGCTLPVSESFGHPSAVVVYPCGHAFHEICSGPDACGVCLRQNVKSLK